MEGGTEKIRRVLHGDQIQLRMGERKESSKNRSHLPHRWEAPIHSLWSHSIAYAGITLGGPAEASNSLRKPLQQKAVGDGFQ